MTHLEEIQSAKIGSTFKIGSIIAPKKSDAAKVEEKPWDVSIKRLSCTNSKHGSGNMKRYPVHSSSLSVWLLSTCQEPLPVVISPVAVASQDLAEAGDKAEVIIIELRNFDKLT